MRCYFVVLFLLCSYQVLAGIQLPSIFNNGMILQQDSEVKIWGRTDSPQVIQICPSWANKVYKTVPDKKGNWIVKIQTPKADLNYYHLDIIQDDELLHITDILFGEVWLCSGQSNMEMKMKGYYGKPIIGGREAIANSRNDYIRIFEVPKQASPKETFDCDAHWRKANPLSVANISATSYYFGKQLFQTLHVPIALIVAPWGGASIVAFMSRDALTPYSQYKLPDNDDKELGNMSPTALFNGMINPILGYTIKGGIWYQGETNRNEPDLYRKLFHSMLTDWRAKWEIGDFPFIYAQIAPFDYQDGNSAYFREAQLLCQYENTNAYMVTLLDIGEEHDIHPSDKQTVGFRMAMAALDKAYQVGGIYSDEPIFHSFKVRGEEVIVSFKNVSRGLTTYGKPLTSFFIAGENRIFYPAEAFIKGNDVVVYSKNVSKPVAVRYAFMDYVKGCLYNIEGCCASSFRTDNWDEDTCKYSNK